MCPFSELPRDLDRPFKFQLLFPQLQAPSSFSPLLPPGVGRWLGLPSLSRWSTLDPAADFPGGSTLSPLPGQSALRWASSLSLSECRAPTGAEGSLGPGREGFAGLGTGQRVWHTGSSARMLTSQASSVILQAGLLILFWGILFLVCVRQGLKSGIDKRRAKKFWKMTVGLVRRRRRRREEVKLIH